MTGFFGDFSREERWRTAVALLRKDLRRVWIAWLVTLIVAGFFAFFLTGAAINEAMFAGDWVWSESTLSFAYAGSVGFHLLGISICLLLLYGEEVRLGTIRSIALFPIDLNDITLGKLLSSTVAGGGVGLIAFLVPLTPFFAVGRYPLGDFVLINVVALLSVLTVLAFGSFFGHLLMATLRRYQSPAGWASLMGILAILTTKTIAFGVLDPLTQASLPPGTPFDERFALRQSVDLFTAGLAFLSPFHVGGRLLAAVFGLNPRGLDFYFVLPVFILVVIFGFYRGQKVYLDVFFR